MYAPNANMVTSSFDRINGNASSVINQPFNNFRITNSGGNIIQGQLNKISVTEVMMPYNTPTVTGVTNAVLYFSIYDIPADTSGGDLSNVSLLFFDTIDIPNNFYTGQEMVDELNNAILNDQGLPMNQFVTFQWDATNQIIQVEATGLWDNTTGGLGVQFYAYSGVDDTVTSLAARQVFSYPNLLWTIGLRNFFAPFKLNPTAIPGPVPFNLPMIVSLGTPAPTVAALQALGVPVFQQVVGSQYSGRYTDYIDIVSTSLSQAQYIRDSSTSQANPKRDIIARIYICTNVSTYTADGPGSRPFTIYRNFTNPKIIKWTADRSIDAIDLQLFDMYGLPLPNAVYGFPATLGVNPQIFDCGPSNYAITFHVHEPAADVQNENVGYML
jgi:hypothetical protein